MRGADVQQLGIFSYVSVEDRVPRDHPIHKLRLLVDAILHEMDDLLASRYAAGGRESIPPERLPCASLLQVLYSVRSERRLMEQMQYNLLFREFVGLNIDDPVWTCATGTAERDGALALIAARRRNVGRGQGLRRERVRPEPQATGHRAAHRPEHPWPAQRDRCTQRTRHGLCDEPASAQAHQTGLWLGQDDRRTAQAATGRHPGSARLGHLDLCRLQPDPHRRHRRMMESVTDLRRVPAQAAGRGAIDRNNLSSYNENCASQQPARQERLTHTAVALLR